MKNGSKKFYIIGSIVTSILIICVAVLIGVLLIKPNKLNAETDDYYDIVIDRVSTVTVYVEGSGVILKESAHAGDTAHSPLIHDHYQVEKGSEITLIAVNESKIFSSWNVYEKDGETAYDEDLHRSTAKNISFTPTKDARISVNRRDTTANDVGRYMTNRFIIEDAKDLYLLQEAFKLGKNVTTNTLIYDAVIESEDMTIIQYYDEMFKEDPTWASYTTNNQKITAINSTYFTRLQEGYYLVSQNFAYLDKDNTMPFNGIGNATTPFKGVMCGSNNNQYSTISLIIQTVQKAGTNYYGLFGYLDNNAVVRNLKIQTSIGISQSASANQSSVYAGGLAGYNNGAFLYNLDVTARNSIDLNANANSTIYAGGIAGYMTGGIEGYTNIIANGTDSGWVIQTNHTGTSIHTGLLAGYAENAYVNDIELKVSGYAATVKNSTEQTDDFKAYMGNLFGSYTNDADSDVFYHIRNVKITGNLAENLTALINRGDAYIAGLIGRVDTTDQEVLIGKINFQITNKNVTSRITATSIESTSQANMYTAGLFAEVVSNQLNATDDFKQGITELIVDEKIYHRYDFIFNGNYLIEATNNGYCNATNGLAISAGLVAHGLFNINGDDAKKTDILISSDEYNLDIKATQTAITNGVTNINILDHCMAGLVFGYIDDAAYNYTFENINIYSNNTKVIATRELTSKATGDIHVGGFITYSKQTKYDNINLYLNDTEFRADSLSYDAECSADGNSVFVGALIGETQGNGTAAANFANISNIKIAGFDYNNNEEIGHTIKMTAIQNTQPRGNDNYNGENYIGGVIGRSSQTTISNVTNFGSEGANDYIQMQGHQSPDSAFCGGIIGFAQNVQNVTLTVDNCKAYNLSVYCSATIAETYNDPDVFVGGIIGAVFCEGASNFTISNCAVENSDISGVGNERIQLAAGGILGYAAWSGTVNISSSYVYGSKISASYKSIGEYANNVANSRSGGILGRRNSSTVNIEYNAVIDTVITADGGGMAPLVQSSGISHDGTIRYCYSNANLSATGSRTTTNIYGISPNPTTSYYVTKNAVTATGGTGLDFGNKAITGNTIDLFTDMNAAYKYPNKYQIVLEDKNIFGVNPGDSDTIVSMNHSGDNNTSNNAEIWINMLNGGSSNFPDSDYATRREAGWFKLGTVLTYRGNANVGGDIDNPIVTYPHGDKEYSYNKEDNIFENIRYPYDEVANTEYENIGYTESESTTTFNNVLFDNVYTIKVRDNIPQLKIAFKVPSTTSTLGITFFDESHNIINSITDSGDYEFVSTVEGSNILYEFLFTPNTEIEKDTLIFVGFKVGSTTNYLASGFQLNIKANLREIKYVTYADYTPPVNYQNKVDANGNVLGSSNNPYYLREDSTTKLIPVFTRVNDLPIGFDTNGDPIYPEYNSELNVDYVDYELSANVGNMKTNGEFVAGGSDDDEELLGFVNSNDYRNGNSNNTRRYLRTLTFNLVSGNAADIKVYFSTNQNGGNWGEPIPLTSSNGNQYTFTSTGQYRTFRIENTGNTDVVIENISIIRMRTNNSNEETVQNINTFASRGSGTTINGTRVTLKGMPVETGVYYIDVQLKDGSDSEKVYFKFVHDVNVTYTSIGTDINGLTYATAESNYVLESTNLDHYGGLPKLFNVTIGSTTYNYNQIMSNGWIKDELGNTLSSWDLERTYYKLEIPNGYITGNISIDIEMYVVYTIKFDLQCSLFNTNYSGPQTLTFKVIADTHFNDFFTTEKLKEVDDFLKGATSVISGYLCTGFYLVNEADTEISYGIDFDELKVTSIAINTSYTFYARWNFLIELVEAPGTHIQTSFPNSFMIDIDEIEYDDYVNRTISIPINSKKGYVFTVIKDEGFVGEAEVRAYCISNKGSASETITEITIEKYHEDMYLYFIPPEKITGYLCIVTSVSNSEVIVGENTAAVVDEILPQDGVYTFKYAINHKNSVDENGNVDQSFIFNSGIAGQQNRNLVLTKDILIQFVSPHYNVTSKKLEVSHRYLPEGTIIEVYYNLYINNSTTSSKSIIGTYRVEDDDTYSVLLSQFMKPNYTEKAFKEETFAELIGSNEYVSEVYYFVVTPPNGYDIPSNNDGHGNVENEIIFVGYYDKDKPAELKAEGFEDYDYYIEGKRTSKEFANIPIEDNQDLFDVITSETSMQQKIYAVTPSRDTNLTKDGNTYSFIDNQHYHYIDFYLTAGSFYNNSTIRLFDDSSNNSIITSGHIEYGISKLKLELGYAIGDVEILGSTDGITYESIGVIKVDEVNYKEYEIDFTNSDKIYYYFKVDNKALTEIRLTMLQLTDLYYLREFDISPNTLEFVSENTSTKERLYHVISTIVGDVRHDGKKFILGVQFNSSSQIVENIKDLTPIKLNINYIAADGSNATTTLSCNLQSIPGKNVLYFNLSKIIDELSIVKYTFTIEGIPSGYTINCVQLIETSIAEKPAMGEVRVSIK